MTPTAQDIELLSISSPDQNNCKCTGAALLDFQIAGTRPGRQQAKCIYILHT